MSETLHAMDEAIQNVLLFRKQQDPSVFPEPVQNAMSFNRLSDEYAILGATLLCDFLMPNSLPVNLNDPRDIRYLNTYSERMKEYRAARTDQLTGLTNRLGFYDWLENNYREQKNTFAIISIDLSEFKAINDALGHDAGDRALVQAAHFFTNHIRDSRKHEEKPGGMRQHEENKDMIARKGGDEFYIILDLDGVSLEKANEIMQRVITDLENTSFAIIGRNGERGSHGMRVGGVISTPENPLRYQDAIDLSDDLMNAKRNEEDR